MSKNQKVQRLLKESYLAMIKNSAGTKMFRNFYVKIGGKKEDSTRGGELSCAYFVSSVLIAFDLIKKIHLSVNGLLEEMEKCGWKKIKNPRKGSVLVWESKKFDDEQHRHIGFFISNTKAISNNFKKKTPTIHHWTFKRKRKVETILWHQKLEEEIAKIN